MKQTAVEWLAEQMSLEDVCKYSNQLADAKQMEKKQMIDAYLTGYLRPMDDVNSEQYYNPTFKSE